MFKSGLYFLNIGINISVNAIAPGPTNTPLMKDVMGKFNQGDEKISPQAMGKGSDVAEVALMPTK